MFPCTMTYLSEALIEAPGALSPSGAGSVRGPGGFYDSASS